MKTLLLLVALAVLSGCATPYQRVGTDVSGGHSFSRLAEDVFQVEFAANGFTEPRRARDFATLRAAEVCREHNFRYFSIIAEADKSRTEIMHTGGTSYSTGTVNAFGTYSGTTTYTNTAMPVHKPKMALTIKCYTTKPGGHAGLVEDASVAIQTLRAKYKLDERR
jgi:hypothetical protein